MRVSRFTIVGALSVLSISMMQFVIVGPSRASDECSVREISGTVKTISVLRNIENTLNYLALSQLNSIVEIQTGVYTSTTVDRSGGFFGPRVALQKNIDKNEAFLSDLDKRVKRLSAFEYVSQHYENLHKAANAIVAAGYEVLGRLEADDTLGAVQVYAANTIPALNSARRDAYTSISELERMISRAGAHCE